MKRRARRALKRLDRIHKERMKEQARRLMDCITRDACDHPECQYFVLPEDVGELVAFVCEVLAEDEGSRGETG